MKKLILVSVLFVSSYSYACSDLMDTEMRILDSSETVNLCEYSDQVVLVVNVASRCGYTYQYASLQKLYEDYKDDGFVVLGVPSRDFMQEYSDETDVAEFCSTEYGVDFPMFATSKVRGKKANALYKKLIDQSGVSPSWNFNKYLITRDGKVASTFGSKVKPDSPELISKIKELL
jgi:glutathione peroxidase